LLIASVSPKPGLFPPSESPRAARRRLVAPSDIPGKRWEGVIAKKPWEYQVTATMAHLNTPETVPTVIELLRLQTVRPYILVVDTGSSEEHLARLMDCEAEDVEIHCLRAHAYRHSSEPVGVAQDLAYALVQTEYMFNTHTDCFLRRRDYLKYLLTMCSAQCPAVGYEMSPRDWLTDLWEGMVSHTATMVHVPTVHRIGASWNFNRAHTQFGVPRSTQGWPDTETCFNLCLRAAGIAPRLIGHETNYERHCDDWVDHPRSYAGSKEYAPEYHEKAKGWVEDALREARERIAEWKDQDV